MSGQNSFSIIPNEGNKIKDTQGKVGLRSKDNQRQEKRPEDEVQSMKIYNAEERANERVSYPI